MSGVPLLRPLVGFIRRDLRVASSYRMAMIFTLFGGLFTLTVLHFLSRTVGENALLRGRYGADYFSFSLVGVALAGLLRSISTGLSKRLRETQTDGSLEALLAAPLSTLSLLALMSAYPVLLAVGRVVLMFVAGVWLFGAKLQVSALPLVASLGLTVLSFTALGLLSASVVLVFKRGDPLAFALDMATYLFSGVMYPVDVLPRPLQWISNLLPATHALRCLRAATLGSQAGWGFEASIGPLALLCVALWPCAGLALVWARRHVERSGTVGHP